MDASLLRRKIFLWRTGGKKKKKIWPSFSSWAHVWICHRCGTLQIISRIINIIIIFIVTYNVYKYSLRTKIIFNAGASRNLTWLNFYTIFHSHASAFFHENTYTDTCTREHAGFIKPWYLEMTWFLNLYFRFKK